MVKCLGYDRDSLYNVFGAETLTDIFMVQCVGYDRDSLHNVFGAETLTGSW